MLDAYIINEIRKQEIERERNFERRRVWLELPLPPPPLPRRELDEVDRREGPVIIPFRPEMDDAREDAA